MAQELPKHVFSKIQKSCSLHQDSYGMVCNAHAGADPGIFD